MPKFDLSKLNNKHFLALAGNGVISILTLVQTSLIYHRLDIADAGTWVWFLGILGIGESIRNGFLATATIKFLAGATPQRAREVLGSIWFLAIILTVVLCAIDLGFIFFINAIRDHDLNVTAQWFGITFVSSLPYTLMFWILMAEEKYDKILWLRLVNNGSMVLSILGWMFYKEMSLLAILWINFITNMLTNVVGFAMGIGRFKTIFQRTKKCIVEIYHFGKFSLGTNLVSNLLRNTDIIIIKFMLGPAAIAIYNLPAKLMEIVEIPLRSFVGTGMSGMAAAFNQNNKPRVKEILTKYSGMLAIAFIPLAIVTCLFADLAIFLIGGNKYLGTPAASIFRVFMMFSILFPIDRFNGATLDVIHKPKINLYKVIVMLLVNIVADVVGIVLFHYTIYGILMGSLFTLLAGLVFGYIQLKKFIDYSIGEIFVEGLSGLKSITKKALASLKR